MGLFQDVIPTHRTLGLVVRRLLPRVKGVQVDFSVPTPLLLEPTTKRMILGEGLADSLEPSNERSGDWKIVWPMDTSLLTRKPLVFV